MIPHCAQCASSTHPPIPPGEGISEGIHSTGEGISATGEGITASGQPVARQGEPISEGISERLASISDRLAVVAVAAHIMQRRAPHDCYARSIAHETQALALAVRELHRAASSGAPMRAPRIVDASPDTSPDTSPDATRASPSSHREPIEPTRRRSTRTAHTPRQTAPEAPQAPQGVTASKSYVRTPARRQGSLAASGGASAERGAQ